ncbi:twin-arginine translocation signal domain-containing protein [Campylobacter concisus]|uniref:twin-arginine translocation signal domain-containing protein n=1 Tax=Campylobacter concisus TaxID=199 RepID=UPI0011E651A0|nr:twin-arginine translocation signal domain-containing protein [Campylobacter concisus]
MQGSRRDFLKKSLKVGAASGVLAVSAVAKATSDDLAPDDNGVVVGKSNKKEVLYKKSKNWETYYKIAY